MHRLITLRGHGPRALAAILGAAIDHAEEREVQPLAAELARCDRPEALAAIVRNLHRLGPEARGLVRAAGGNWTRAISTAIGDRARRLRLNALLAVAWREDASLLGLAAALLEDAEEDVRSRAGRVVLEIVIAHVGETGRKQPPAHVRRDLDEALTKAVMSQRRHRCDDVLLAAAIFVNRHSPRLSLAKTLLSEPDHPAAFALRGIVERTENRLVRRNLIRWLDEGPAPVGPGPRGAGLSRQSLRWMHRALAGGGCEDVLRDAHLLLTPARRRAARHIDRARRCLRDVTETAALDERVQHRWVDLIAALGLPGRDRRAALADMIALPSPLTRLKAAMHLSGRTSSAAAEALRPFCFDRDAGVAHLAARRLLEDAPSLEEPGQGPDEAHLRRLSRSAHAPVACLAARHLAQRDAEQFFSHEACLSPAWRAAIARTLLTEQPEAFAAALGRRLTDDRLPRDSRLSAIDLARRLRIAGDVEERLTTLAEGADARLASAAIAALGRAPASPRRDAVLFEALRHGEGRVRANAIEALGREGGRALDLIAPLARVGENRPRANAVCALLRARHSRGVDRLREMLSHENPLHRISGIWAAQRTGRPEALPLLHRLVRIDRLPEVQRRAQAAARLISAVDAKPVKEISPARPSRGRDGSGGPTMNPQPINTRERSVVA